MVSHQEFPFEITGVSMVVEFSITRSSTHPAVCRFVWQITMM